MSPEPDGRLGIALGLLATGTFCVVMALSYLIAWAIDTWVW
jgi:hypothetical protein